MSYTYICHLGNDYCCPAESRLTFVKYESDLSIMNFANLNGSEHLALNDRILDAVSIAALQDIRVLISPSVNTTLRNNSSQGP